MAKKLLIGVLIGVGAAWLWVSVARQTRPVALQPRAAAPAGVQSAGDLLNLAMHNLKGRNDQKALALYTAVLAQDAGNVDALWGKAEVLRRARDYGQSAALVTSILKSHPAHIPSKITLAYIRYKEEKFPEAARLVAAVLAAKDVDAYNKALANIMLGTINSRRATKSSLLGKLQYGTHIKTYFLQAKQLCPDLPEASLALGTFYLLAPSLIGGSLDKAYDELKHTVALAPDFATANARLAQVYLKKNDPRNAAVYYYKAKALDAANEVLAEIDQASLGPH